MEEPQNRADTRNPDGTFKEGVSGNPGGRPKNTLKSYVQRKFDKMSDEEKELWLLENKIAGIDQWKMGEGNPAQDDKLDVTGSLSIVFDGAFNETTSTPSTDS